MSETPETVRADPQPMLDALAVVAGYGEGRTTASVEREDGATMMVEVSVLDVTGWERER